MNAIMNLYVIHVPIIIHYKYYCIIEDLDDASLHRSFSLPHFPLCPHTPPIRVCITQIKQIKISFISHDLVKKLIAIQVDHHGSMNAHGLQVTTLTLLLRTH